MGAGKKFGIGIRLVIMAACYFLAVHYNADVQDAAQIAVVSFEADGVTAETAESICEEERGAGQEQASGEDQEQGQEETLSLCFWREQEGLQFSCKETGRTAQAIGLLTEGDPELVARGSGILAWQEKGCVLDAVTAQELFGTQEVNGQLIWCGGEPCTVYGTFESLSRMVVLRAGSGRAAVNLAGTVSGISTEGLSAGASGAPGLSSGGLGYDHLSLHVPQDANVKTEAEQLLMRSGLAGDVADFTFPGVVCANLLLALPILLAAGLMRALWNCLREKTGRIACTAMLAAAAAAFFFLLRDHMQIPADMIPTRWSDFSFWPQWWAGQKANLLQILGGAQGEMQLEALWSFGLSVVSDILAIGAGINIFHCITSANKL